MKTKTLILTISVIILSSFSNLAIAKNHREKLLSETNAVSPLMRRFMTDKTIDWRYNFPTFKNYTAKEIMQLCEEFGKLYEEGKISGESAITVSYLLKALDIRKELDLNLLLNIVADETKPAAWRGEAGRVACGREFIIPIERIDMNKVYDVYTKIIKDNSEDINLRVTLCSALSRQLAKQYGWIAFPEKMKTKLSRATIDEKAFDEIIKTNEKVKAEIIKHDQKIEKYMNFLNEILISKDMPDKLKTEGISSIVHFRGSKTPGLEKIKETLNSLIPPIPEITIVEVSSSISNAIVNVNEKIKKEPSNAALLKLTKRNLLRREYVNEHFTDQEKRYLRTLNDIDSVLAKKQN